MGNLVGCDIMKMFLLYGTASLFDAELELRRQGQTNAGNPLFGRSRRLELTPPVQIMPPTPTAEGTTTNQVCVTTHSQFGMRPTIMEHSGYAAFGIQGQLNISRYFGRVTGECAIF